MMRNNLFLLVFILLKLFINPALSREQPHWIILPFSPIISEPYILFVDINSFKTQPKQGTVFAKVKTNFGTPPTEVEKNYILNDVEISCVTNKMKITSEAIINQKPSSIKQTDVKTHDENSFIGFDYLFKKACRYM